MKTKTLNKIILRDLNRAINPGEESEIKKLNAKMQRRNDPEKKKLDNSLRLCASASQRLNFHFCLHLLFLTAVPLFSLGQQSNITFDQQDGKEICVRGYLHHAGDDSWALTPEPNTPSCCVAASHKSGEQVILQGTFTSSNQPVTFQGLLHVDSHHPQYVLMNAKMVDSDKRSFPWVSFSFAIVLFGIITLIKLRSKEKIH